VSAAPFPPWPPSRWQGYDVIGDVHGHADKLERLLERLGYRRTTEPDGRPLWAHPDRQAIFFVGDLIDRGPHQIQTVELVRTMVDGGSAQQRLRAEVVQLAPVARCGRHQVGVRPAIHGVGVRAG